MGRNARKRISYVLPLAESAGGHRLGVNGLAVDSKRSILYSGGRDGVICAWNLGLDLSATDFKPPTNPPTSNFRQQVQAHSHWINDIVLAQNNEALITASSDITVKLWRPNARDAKPPETIGLHSDYVKCLASPGPNSGWVASGGLDRKICLWDLNGTGQTTQIKVGEDETNAKGSVYALAANETLLASGGPESIVRVWDPRSGKRVTNFVGHTDNVRAILINEYGDMVMTASSDQTVKVWSITAGRCMYTLTMHNDSVWSLHSDHPQLSVFYSSDKSGLVAKTDVRNCSEMDQGLSVAVCQEHQGVSKVIHAGNYIWTATSSSSINRWNDVNTAADVALPENYRFHRMSVATTRSRLPSPPIPGVDGAEAERIPVHSILRTSNSAPLPFYASRDNESIAQSVSMVRKPSEPEQEHIGIVPIRNLPDHSIEGQNGLIKHFLLNDKRRVLTLDTAGEVSLWDLMRCELVKSFGKRHIEDVGGEINTVETVAPWCAVDTRTGSLTIALEENNCFDAEMYADELELADKLDFREDQRINLGKWILRYLFSNLIDEEIKRDEVVRQHLTGEKKPSMSRANAPPSIELPKSQSNGWSSGITSAVSPAVSTPRATNGALYPTTPGLHIGLATPALPTSSPVSRHVTPVAGKLTPTAEEGGNLSKISTHQSQNPTRTSTDGNDYFSTPTSAKPATTPGGSLLPRVSESQDDTTALPQSPSEEKNTSKTGGFFGSKKFSMGFSMKKLGKEKTNDTSAPAMEEKSEDSDAKSSTTDERVIEDNFLGVVQRIRHQYEDILSENNTEQLQSEITPSLPNETPVLKPPRNTTILIQEDKPESGGLADLFEGTVASLSHPSHVDIVEKVAPMWLGDVLLRNQIPLKDIVKVSFVLEPWNNALPPVATEGNNRLNANRMLRARKIMAYVAERIEPASEEGEEEGMKPEEYLEIYCQDKLIPPTMTLATIRTHVWRGGGDVLLYYKANGKKEIMHQPILNLGAPSESGESARKVSSEAGA